MDSQLKNIAQRHGKEHLLKTYQELDEDCQLRIGFVGMFSAGKTSLINTLLGTQLPVGLNPTTKAICLIESKGDLSKPCYFIEEGDSRRECTWSEFDNLLNGDSRGVAVLNIPPTPIMPSGTVFIDTPGLDNYSSDEADLTYEYLSRLDAVIVCVDITQGTLTQKVIEFLSSPNFFPLINNTIFVLTHADRKTELAAQTIRAEIESCLHRLGARLAETGGLESRIVLFSTIDPDRSEDLLSVLRSGILSKREVFLHHRETLHTEAMAHDLTALLQEDLKSLDFDDSTLAQKKKECLQKSDDFEKMLDEQRSKRNTLRDELEDIARKTMLSYQLRVTDAGGDKQALTKTLEEMNNEICSSIKNKVDGFVEGAKISQQNLAGTDVEIQKTMETIERVKDFSVMIGTAILTAYILPAAGAANVAEAAGGAALKNASSEAVKQAAKKGAEVALKKTGEVAVKESAGFLMKAAPFLKAIEKLNPVEHLGRFAGDLVKHSNFESLVARRAPEIADNVMRIVDEMYERQIYAPIRMSLHEQADALDRLEHERRQGRQLMIERRESIKQDLRTLSKYINGK